jgi:hypothetical protein
MRHEKTKHQSLRQTQAGSIYVSVATLADKQLGNVLGQIFGSPWAIALQIGLLVAVCLLPLVNWRRFLDRTTKP